MPSTAYVYQALESFRHLFSRRVTWALFSMVVLAFLAAPEAVGVTSFCRFWGLGEVGYHCLLRLFRSSAWSLPAMIDAWVAFVASQQVMRTVGDRIILLGDHTQVVKDATRMPGVVTLHAHSETQSKPSYFRGQLWGVVGVLIGSPAASLCLPLIARIHLGYRHLLVLQSEDPYSMATRPVAMALNLAIAHQLPAILVLDAFFAVSPVFALANSVWSLAIRAPYLHILTRAKKDYVAYEPALKPERPGRGRPRKYGRKIKLTEVFTTDAKRFCTARVSIYGKEEEISYLACNLLWKPIGWPIRFIFVVTSLGPIVLMSSDLTLAPVHAIELYCCRIRIEIVQPQLTKRGGLSLGVSGDYIPNLHVAIANDDTIDEELD